jgi:hypothetical protein
VIFDDIERCAIAAHPVGDEGDSGDQRNQIDLLSMEGPKRDEPRRARTVPDGLTGARYAVRQSAALTHSGLEHRVGRLFLYIREARVSVTPFPVRFRPRLRREAMFRSASSAL